MRNGGPDLQHEDPLALVSAAAVLCIAVILAYLSLRSGEKPTSIPIVKTPSEKPDKPKREREEPRVPEKEEPVAPEREEPKTDPPKVEPEAPLPPKTEPKIETPDPEPRDETEPQPEPKCIWQGNITGNG